MAFKFDIRNFALAVVFSLITITILSMLISQYTDLETIKTGKAFLIIFIGVFISVVFLAAVDKKIDKEEIVTIVIVAVILTGAFFAIQKFIPEIFTSFPTQTKQLFSAIN